MTQNKKAAIFILSGLAVWAYYKYASMNAEEKRDLQARLRETGKKLIGPFVPSSVKDKLAKEESIDNDVNYGTSTF